MAPLAARRARRNDPRLFEGPVLFVRSRREIAELVGLVWLALEVAQFVRNRVKASVL